MLNKIFYFYLFYFDDCFYIFDFFSIDEYIKSKDISILIFNN